MSNSFPALYSFKNERMVANNTAMIIPKLSTMLPWKYPVISESRVAKSKSFIIGSLNLPSNNFTQLSRFGGVRSFVPYFLRLSETSAEVSPL